MKKGLLRIMAWLMILAMTVPSVGNATIAFAEEGKVAHEGSATFSDSTWWTEYELSIAELLGDVAPEDVNYVKFTSDTAFAFGYVSEAGSWVQLKDQTSYSIGDILWDGFGAKLALSKNDGVNYTINWEVIVGGDKIVTEKPKSTEGYVGDYQGARIFSVAEFQEYAGREVTISFDYEAVAGYDQYQYMIVNNITGWPKLSASDFKDLKTSISEWGFISLEGKEGSVSITLTKDAVNKIIADGGGAVIQVFGIIVTNPQLSGQKKPVATPTPTPTPIPTPVPVKEEEFEKGDVLVVTEDMVKNGKVTIEKVQYNRIVIPADLSVDNITVKTAKVGEVVVESGADYTVTLSNAEVGSVSVTAPDYKEMTIEELTAKLAEAKDAEAVTAAVEEYHKSMLEKNRIASLAPVVETTYFSTVGTINVEANAKLNVNGCEVGGIALAISEDAGRAWVTVDGYAGKISADLEAESNAYGAVLDLRLVNSEIAELDIQGTNGICSVTGNTSTTDSVKVSGVKNVSLNVDSKEVLVDAMATGSKVTVYSEVENLTVAGDKTDVTIPMCGSIASAKVEGNSVRIYGIGNLGEAEITGEGANVAVPGTAVEGQNDFTAPPEMEELIPEFMKPSPQPPASADPNAGYAGDYKGGYFITAEELAKFTGDVTMEVTFHTHTDSKYGWYNFSVIDNGLDWEAGKLYNKDFTFMQNPVDEQYGNIPLSKTGTSTSMTLKESVVKQIIANGGGIVFMVYGVIIDDVVLSNKNLNENPDLAYKGDWTKAFGIPASEFTRFVDTVTVTVDYRLLSTASTGYMAFFKEVSPWEFFKENSFVDLAYPVDREQNITFTESGTATIVLTKEAVADIISAGKGLSIQTKDIIVEGATVAGEQSEAPVGPQPVETVYYTTDEAGEYVHQYYYFKPRDFYEGEELGENDSLKITVKMSSDAWFSGAMGAFVATQEGFKQPLADSEFKDAAEFTIVTTEKLKDGLDTQVQIEFYYIDPNSTGVDIDSIVVERVEGSVTPPPTGPQPIETLYHVKDDAGNYVNQVYRFAARDFYEGEELGENDSLKITVKMSSDAYFSGAMGAFVKTQEGFKQPLADSEFKDAAEFTIVTTEKLKEGLDTTVQIEFYYIDPNSTGVDIDSIVVERVEGSVTPPPTENTLTKTYFINSGYSGDYSSIGNKVTARALQQFTGDVTVTVDYDALAGEYAQFACAYQDAAAGYATIKFPTSASNDDLFHGVQVNASGQVTFTIAAEDVATVIEKGGFGFLTYHVIVRQVTLSGEGTELPDDAFKGNYVAGHTFYESELIALGASDAVITVKCKRTTATAPEGGNYQINLAKAYAGTDISSAGWHSVAEEGGVITIDLSADEIAAILALGDGEGRELHVKVNGVIIEEAWIRAAE